MTWLLPLVVGALVAVLANDIHAGLPKAGFAMARLATRWVPREQRTFYAFEADVHGRWQDSRDGLCSRVSVFARGLQILLWVGPKVRLHECGVRPIARFVARVGLVSLILLCGGALLREGYRSVQFGVDEHLFIRESRAQMQAVPVLTRSVGLNKLTLMQLEAARTGAYPADFDSSLDDLVAKVARAEEAWRDLEATYKGDIAAANESVVAGIVLFGNGLALALVAMRSIPWAVRPRRSVLRRSARRLVVPFGVLVGSAASGLALDVAWDLRIDRGLVAICLSSLAGFLFILCQARAERRINRTLIGRALAEIKFESINSVAAML